MNTAKRTLLAASLALLCAVARAQPPSAPVALNIPAQRMQDALNVLAEQAGLQVVFAVPSVKGITSPKLEGLYTPEAALKMLLAGTSLSYEFIGEKIIAIRAAQTARQGMRITQVEKPSSPSEEGQDEGPSPSKEGEGGALEVIVTGSRLRIRADEGAAPVTVFDRERIDRLGVSAVSDILKYLPQQPYAYGAGFRTGGAQFAEIRGLGLDTTLVLINGRRTVPSSANITSNAFDLNTLPLAAVERVEILSDSASAVYGADAMGGVINVVLKRGGERPTLDLDYGAARGGADERRASFGAGYATARLRTSMVLDYFDRDFLLGAERDRYADQDFRRFDSADQRSLNTNPGNVTSRTAGNLPGLPSPFAVVPAGSSGVGLTPASFLPTAGQRSLDSLNRFWSIVPQAYRRSAFASVELDLASRMTAFGEFLHVDKSNAYQYYPSTFTAVVPANNPFNPFGAAVTVNYLFTGVGPRRAVTDADLNRGVAGLKGSWSTWDWELSLVKTRDKSASWTENAVDTAVQANCLLSNPASRVPSACLGITEALNVFQDGPGGSPTLLASLVTQPVSRYLSEGTQGGAFLRGPLMSLPAGPVDVVAGGELRKESILFNDFLFVSHDRRVRAAFAELRIPMVGSHSPLPAVKDLSLTVAARHDHYSDFGGTFNPQFGLVWKPVSSLLVRISQGTSFRPPSLYELYSPKTAVPVTIADPRRNNQSTNVSALSGGNPDLDPLAARSFSAGLVLTLPAVADLRLAATYWRVKLNQRVATFSRPLLLANEASFPERVVRGQPGPTDPPGFPGAILTIDTSRINFGSIDTHGIDFSAGYFLDTGFGRIAPNLSVTWVGKYDAVNLPNTPAVHRVALAASDGTIARWRAVATLGWQRSGYGLSTTMRYLPPYRDVSLLTGLTTGRTIPAQTVVDLQGSVDLDQNALNRQWLRGLRITAGISNLLDREPEFADVGFNLGYDPSQGDLVQRFVYLKMAKSF